MVFIIGLGLLAAFAAALLHPYGRKLLGVMGAIVAIGIVGVWILGTMQQHALDQTQREEAAKQAVFAQVNGVPVVVGTRAPTTPVADPWPPSSPPPHDYHPDVTLPAYDAPANSVTTDR